MTHTPNDADFLQKAFNHATSRILEGYKLDNVEDLAIMFGDLVATAAKVKMIHSDTKGFIPDKTAKEKYDYMANLAYEIADKNIEKVVPDFIDMPSHEG